MSDTTTSMTIRLDDVTIDQPNSATLKAMENTQNNVDMHGPFNTVKELMKSLNADD